MRRMHFRVCFPRWVITLALLFIFLTPTAHSQYSGSSEPLTSGDAETFFDQYFAQHMEELHVPGAAVALVKDSDVVVIRGYGYSNIEQKILSDPNHTVFRLASVSKVFTATAVLQLVEQGKLRLDEDVNHYLRLFQLEANYPKPVTLENLLTHTAGLDDRSIGITSHSATEEIPLGAYLSRRLAARVMPAGDQYSYSNDGFALAGYIAEVSSGMPFAQYVEKYILKPLEMRRSGFVITPELFRTLAVGYDYRNGRFVPVALDYPNIVPAVSMVSTASDMAHFMIAELRLGRYGTQRILSEDSVRRMFQRQYTNDARLPGTALAYWEEFPNETRALRQDGDWIGAVSTIYLLPKEKVGIFVACNIGDQRLIDDLLRQFVDRFYPTGPEHSAGRAKIESPDPSARFAGSYRMSRYAHRTIEKLGTLLREWEVFPGENGRIILVNPNTGPGHCVPVGPLLFRRDGSGGEMAFREDEHGRIDRLFIGRYALEKLPWYQIAIVHEGLFVFFGCVFAFSVFIALSDWIKKRRPRTPPPADKGLTRLRYWTAGVASGNLLFLAGLILAFLNKGALIYGLPFYMTLLLCIPLITTAGTLVITWQVWTAWRTRSGNAISRAFYTLTVFAAVCFVPFLAYWNLLGFHY
jgi:CubicO group peptidase (beta-lactamase class C family)